MNNPTQQSFLKDVADHSMTVLLDDGLYRHIRFQGARHPWNQWFDIVTWPGRLAYSGDMGTFVFARLEDMFEFFRSRPSGDPSKLFINTGYWAEKLQAVDRDHRNNSEMAFSEELFLERVEEHVSEWINEYPLTGKEKKELREAIAENVLCYADDGEYEAHRALREFSAEVGGHKFEFCDTWEWNLREYTYRFVWCCYAIAWSIQQYDKIHVKAGKTDNGE
jgi:hypothetical protein